MKPHNEMTLEECRAELAEAEGWTYSDDHDKGWTRPGYPGWMGVHPIPATLDAAAAAMPEHWQTSMVCRCFGDWSKYPEKKKDDAWCAMGMRAADSVTGRYRAFADTELLARFRLAVAARRAMGGKEGKE